MKKKYTYGAFKPKANKIVALRYSHESVRDLLSNRVKNETHILFV